MAAIVMACDELASPDPSGKLGELFPADAGLGRVRSRRGGWAMMIARRHTPGPWKAVLAFGYKVTGPDGRVIAKLPTYAPLTWENPANAHLIASAPDLLAACQAALAALEDQPNIPSETLACLRAAIAEATCESIQGWMPTDRHPASKSSSQEVGKQGC